jgi:hypothetical protein
LTILFKSECKTKFGNELGEEVWEEVNQVFDCLPLAAVVDSKIFCIHGGIPSFSSPNNNANNNGSAADLRRSESSCCIELINSIKCPLKDPESESQLAWELLWNDPFS